MKTFLFCLSVAFLLNACSFIEPVKPWEKADLSKEIMKEGGVNPEITKFESHVYFSKEASRGGSGVAGGGCGCN